MSNELKRYGPWIDWEPNGEDAFARMSEEDNGDYVLHSDALAAIEAARIEERQACLAICESKHHSWRFGDGEDDASGPRDCAEAIFARGGI